MGRNSSTLYSSVSDCNDGIVILPLSTEMVPRAAQVHLQTLAATRTAMMGETYVRAFMDWFRLAEGGVALAAVDDSGNVLGYVIGAPLGYAKGLNRDLWWIAAHAVIKRPCLFFRPQFRNGFVDRLSLLLGNSQVPTAHPDLPFPTMSIVAIGVSKAAQGRKIGMRLMRTFETRAQELNMRSLRLSTRSDNVAACRLYERCGWQAEPASDGQTYYSKILSVNSRS